MNYIDINDTIITPVKVVLFQGIFRGFRNIKCVFWLYVFLSVDNVYTMSYIISMRFEWNEEKNRENIRKHELGFTEVQEIFNDPFHVSLLDTRFNYFEERWVTIGCLKNGMVVVAGHLYLFDENGEETIRLITARKATSKEREQYEIYGR